LMIQAYNEGLDILTPLWLPWHHSPVTLTPASRIR
jgi:hypothetical protein